MSYPEQWPPQQPPYPAYGAAPYPPSVPPRRKHGMVLLAVLAPAVILVLVVIGSVAFYVIHDVARDGLDGRGGSQEATALSNFDVVCDRGSIANAATFAKPYKIAAFAANVRPNPLTVNSHDQWTDLKLDAGADYTVTRENFRSVNVVACLSLKPGTEVKSLNCALKTETGGDVTVDYYAVQYNIELREARTGKHITQLGPVNAPAVRCPFLLWIKKHDAKMYAEPDPAAVNAELAAFAHS